MAMYDASDANNVLAANLGIGGFTYPAVTATHLRLGTGSAPTATVDMTELTGTGYTAGGQAISWNAPSGQSTTNSGAVSWTNASGSTWAITNLEIWDTAGTPLRHYFGQWTSQPISVTNGNTFVTAAAAVSASLV
jgi:hypothetical protein